MSCLVVLIKFENQMHLVYHRIYIKEGETTHSETML